MEHDELKSVIRENILSCMDFSRDVNDEEMLERIDRGILEYCKDQSLELDEKLRLRKELFYSIRKLDVLQLLVDEKSWSMERIIYSLKKREASFGMR